MHISVIKLFTLKINMKNKQKILVLKAKTHVPGFAIN